MTPTVWTRWPTVVDIGGGQYDVWAQGTLVTGSPFASFDLAQTAAATGAVKPMTAYTPTQLAACDAAARTRDNWQLDGSVRAPLSVDLGT